MRHPPSPSALVLGVLALSSRAPVAAGSVVGEEGEASGECGSGQVRVLVATWALFVS